MNEKSILVAAAIIEKDDKILIAQRKNDSKLEPNMWEFAGGKVEFGEKPEDCLIREIKEELDLEIEIKKLFGVYSHVYEKEGTQYHVILITYICKYISGQKKNIECQDSLWVSKEELSNYEYAKADVKIVDDYVRN
ncbi:MAG: (deoxy)nucleoside triphosphate pyrophosphohydrolase [Candidatus Woesearchaeota archaeon]|jgi:8-oxo-dGTP diphosphatase|nr:(deoxy)nucleoside triphosphate pyrophosphohydrolase [Candidatus Woesearchaeota archaeon]